MRIATLFADPAPAAALRMLPGAPAEARETTTEEAHGPHQGSKAGEHQEARPRRRGHRLAAGADRNAHAAHQRADRASAHAQARPLLPPRAAEARRPAPPLPDVSPEARPRGLSRPDQGARPA